MSYDIESYCGDLETHLKANLNTKIAAINTEKNDTITLLTINDSAYAFQTMDTTVQSFDPFIYYGIDKVDSLGIGPATMSRYSIIIAVILADPEGDAFIGKRLLRYNRALSEVLEDKYGGIGDSLKAKVMNREPISFQLVNESHPYRAIGVTLEITIA